jgi:hypothetical protein
MTITTIITPQPTTTIATTKKTHYENNTQPLNQLIKHNGE